MKTELLRTDTNNPDFNRLISLLDSELWERYPDLQGDYEDKNVMISPFMAILVYVDDQAVSCGALRPVDNDVFELKRMFTCKDHRGKGYSRRVLHELERWAVEKGCRRIILETGIKQHEAISFYEKEKYTRIENYGEYKGNENSICMAKNK